MNNSDLIIETLERRQHRREERREFLRTAGSAAVAMGGVGLLAACGDGNNATPLPAPTPPPTGGTPTPTPPATGLTDVDVLNFALNLEYLEAQFYSYAAFGIPLEQNLLTGSGNAGAVTGGRRANLTDPIVARYAREIAIDEIAHVRFLRQAIGASTVSQPAIDIGSEPNGAFSAAARAAGLIGAGQSFDPYANDNNFLLGAFIFEDVGVTAYKGASPLITNKTFLEAAAGILAAEAYHAGLIRTVLYGRGVETPTLRDATESISNARDSLDGPTDLDQGVRPIGAASNIVPTDANGLAFSRSAGQVLNIVYLNRAAVGSGGFFPAGVNGNIRVSAASG
jgi:hypothetical protein